MCNNCWFFLQVLDFDKVEVLCEYVFFIYKEYGEEGFLEEVVDWCFLVLVLSVKGNYEKVFENLMFVLIIL